MNCSQWSFAENKRNYIAAKYGRREKESRCRAGGFSETAARKATQSFLTLDTSWEVMQRWQFYDVFRFCVNHIEALNQQNVAWANWVWNHKYLYLQLFFKFPRNYSFLKSFHWIQKENVYVEGVLKIELSERLAVFSGVNQAGSMNAVKCKKNLHRPTAFIAIISSLYYVTMSNMEAFSFKAIIFNNNA